MTDVRMRGETMRGIDSGWPKEICLSSREMHELVSLTVREQSAMEFWKRTFHVRGISCPQGRVCAMVYMAPDQFCLEWHKKALGPKAIAAGRDYRTFAARKDKEFATRASR